MGIIPLWYGIGLKLVLTFLPSPISPVHRNRTPRIRFCTRDFARHYSLGSPVAGNFFIAQYDDYVPVILSRYPASDDY